MMMTNNSVSNCAPSEFRVILYPFNYLENKTTFDLNFEMALLFDLSRCYFQ